MNIINESDYNPNMGVLIDVKDSISYKEKHNIYSINIPFNKLLTHYNDYLNKYDNYYIMCDKGNLSKKAVRILSYYGYNVTYVINS